ncbi:MAG: N-acetyl sugar amidotransferase [Gammaproteobacteria bacterium]|nr:N-acetyl sugar amidotransferase [Gammaproteobacteria bacterium]
MKVKHCIKCAMPNTRPDTKFINGICQACINFNKRLNIDWKIRNKDLLNLSEQYKNKDSYYDCIIPVSGGKDSYFQVYTIKEEFGMNPLLLTVDDWFTHTNAGIHNLRNLINEFSCDHISFKINEPLFRKVGRIGFENSLDPLRYLETLITTVPFKLAADMNIPLVIYGESEYEYGSWKSGFDTTEFINNKFTNFNKQYWIDNGIKYEDMSILEYPKNKKNLPKVIVLSYFKPWSSTSNLRIAKKYGFNDLINEWNREGYIENFQQIDSIGYMVHLWLKFPKFGFQRTSDIASRLVREGGLTLQEAQKLIMKNDYKLDQLALNDFCRCFSYSKKEFWNIVNKFWNPNIFEYKNNEWSLQPDFYSDFKL